jgi:hydroxyacylglutathione hydrolase
LKPEQAILLITESPEDLQQATEHLFRIGYDTIAGYLHSGMKSWQTAGLPLQRIAQMPVEELNQHLAEEDLTILDVRSDQEYLNGAIPGSSPHLFAPPGRADVGQARPYQSRRHLLRQRLSGLYSRQPAAEARLCYGD